MSISRRWSSPPTSTRFLHSCLPREDGDNIYGRGACDAKGIIAAQIAACERLRKSGKSAGLLFVVGEERDSLGAAVANQNPRGSRFLVNGEPTDNRIALASKGALRVEVTAHGRMAHSAYPELGESAIDKLLDALQALRAMPLPHNPEIGPSTVNIGIIEGGRATNVIPDFAKAQLLYRLVGPSQELRDAIVSAVGSLAEVQFVLDIPYMRFLTVPGIPTMTASFTTDIPQLSAWGRARAAGSGLDPGGAHGPGIPRQGRADAGHRAVCADRNISAGLIWQEKLGAGNWLREIFTASGYTGRHEHEPAQRSRPRLLRLSPIRHEPAHAVARVGRGGIRARQGGGQADPARHRRGVVPLVPRHGPRVVRIRRDRSDSERALHCRQGGPR